MCYLRAMPKLSIDITPEAHQKLKRTLGDAPALDDLTEDESVAALADFLKPRIAQAQRGEISTRSMDGIRRQAHRQAGL